MENEIAARSVPRTECAILCIVQQAWRSHRQTTFPASESACCQRHYRAARQHLAPGICAVLEWTGGGQFTLGQEAARGVAKDTTPHLRFVTFTRQA